MDAKLRIRCAVDDEGLAGSGSEALEFAGYDTKRERHFARKPSSVGASATRINDMARATDCSFKIADATLSPAALNSTFSSPFPSARASFRGASSIASASRWFHRRAQELRFVQRGQREAGTPSLARREICAFMEISTFFACRASSVVHFCPTERTM